MNFKIRAIRRHAQITSSNSELKNTITHKGLQCLMMDRLIAVARPTLRPRGVLWTSSDGDGGRILWVLNFRFRDFLSWKTWQVCFRVAWFKKGFLGGIQKYLKIRDRDRASRPRGFANKVQPNFSCYIIYCFLKNFKARKFDVGFFEGLIFGPTILLGFVGSPRNYLGFLIFAPFDYPHYMKSGVQRE